MTSIPKTSRILDRHQLRVSCACGTQLLQSWATRDTEIWRVPRCNPLIAELAIPTVLPIGISFEDVPLPAESKEDKVFGTRTAFP